METSQPAPAESYPEVVELLRTVTPRVWATPAISGLLIVCFVGSVLRGVDPVSPTVAQLFEVGGSFGPAIVGGQWWRLLTASLLHGGILHLAFNLWAFWTVGLLTERLYGQPAFLTIYVLSALGASLLSVAVKPLVLSVGASGAIFGIYGALLAFVLGHRGTLPRGFLLKQRSSLFAFLVYNLLFALTDKQVDLSGHLGGLLTGLAGGWLLRRDLLHPSADSARRVAGATGLALALLLGAWEVRARLMPELRDQRCDEAAEKSRDDPARIQAAIDECSSAVKTSRNPASPRTMRAWLRTKQGMTSDAIQELDEILTDSPSYSPALQLRASVLLDGKRVDEAERDCARLDEARRGDYWPHATCSDVALRRGDAALAVKRASLVLEQRPGYEWALRVRERARTIQRDLPGAISDLDELLRLHPSDAILLNSRAWLRVARGNLAGGREDVEKALAARPEYAPALGTRCFALAAQGDPVAARRDCTAAVRLSHNAIDVGMLAFLDGKRDEALRLWKSAAEATPSEAGALEPWIAKASSP